MREQTYTAAQVQGLLSQIDQLRQERLSLLAQLSHMQKRPQGYFEDEQTIEEIGRFSVGLLHDLRGSLGVAQHHASRLIEETKQPTASRIKEQITFCQLTLRNWELVSSIVQPHPEWVQLETAVSPALSLLNRKLHGIKTRIAISKTLPPLWIDPLQLQQLLFVLCKNSAEAMPNGGVLRLLAWQENSRTLLQISDDGIGISPRRLPALFGLRESSKPHGVGMGLRVAQKIMQQTGGEISVVSDVGVGTTVALCWQQEREQST